MNQQGRFRPYIVRLRTLPPLPFGSLGLWNPWPEVMTKRSCIKFVNQTERFVDVMLNIKGKLVRENTLAPGQFLDMNTIAGHSWIAQDSNSGDRLMVQQRDVFHAPALPCTAGSPLVRLQVNITLPVFSLQERCIQVICQNLAPGSAEALALPPPLIGLVSTAQQNQQSRKAQVLPPQKGIYSEDSDGSRVFSFPVFGYSDTDSDSSSAGDV